MLRFSSKQAKARKSEVGMRRHITPEEKARLVLLLIKSKKSAASLCKEHRIGESSYYCWRKAFVLAGTAALRRPQKRNARKAIAMRSRHEKLASMERAKANLLKCVEAAQTKSIGRRARLTGTARQKIFELVQHAAIPKVSAVAVAGVARHVLSLAKNCALQLVAGTTAQANVYQALRSGFREKGALQNTSFAAIRSWLQ